MSTHLTDDGDTTGATDPTRGDTSPPITPLGVGGSVPTPGKIRLGGSYETSPKRQTEFLVEHDREIRSPAHMTLILDANEILVWATQKFGHGDGAYDCPEEDCPDCARGLAYTQIVLGVIDQA